MAKQSIVTILLFGMMTFGSAHGQEKQPCNSGYPHEIQSANGGKVKGMVVLDDASLPGATVVLENATSRCLQVTNGDGRFEFSDVPPGDYHLSAELVGLKSRPRKHVAVAAGDVTEIKFRMRLDKSIRLACGGDSPMNLPDGTFVITRDMIENFPTN